MSEVPGARERFLEVDIWRAFAIIGVLLIHIEGGSIHFFKAGSLTFFTFLILDQLLRYSVPLFVLISGFTLAHGYAKDVFSLRIFIKKRLLRILPWYFFWSGVIYLYTRFIFPEKVLKFPLWELIFLGKTDYHLYFVSMIFQFYLLFPLFLFFFKKNWRLLLVFSFLFQSAVYLISSLNAQGIFKLPFVWYDQQQYVFFGSWIFYFVLGMVFTKAKFESAIIGFKKIMPWLLILFFIWAVFDTFRLLSLGDLIIAERSTRIPLLFCTTIFLTTLFCYRNIHAILPERIVNFLVYLGKLSYVIYLLHTLVLRLVSKFIMPDSILNLVIYTTLVMVLSVLLAEVSTKIAGLLAKVIFHRKQAAVFT